MEWKQACPFCFENHSQKKNLQRKCVPCSKTWDPKFHRIVKGKTVLVEGYEYSGYGHPVKIGEPDVRKKAKIMFLNYPNNPTGAVVEADFFEKVIDFAKAHDIAVMHDASYSEVAFDGYRPPSFLEAEGAREVGIEFHSLSKSYNMTGWRIGMAVGNAEIIDALMRVKSNLDSGIPQAIQRMAIAALEGPQECIEEHNLVYQRRRDRLVTALRGLGLRVSPPKASLYVWARVPDGTTSVQYATQLLDEAGVVVTPGTGYGPSGEGYVRLSLTLPDERLEEGVRRLVALRV
ncbi:MAG: aminotransferase class I/II-fold pyridoxal phosphate-dependent enzyme [Chloroflexi bacterium]|nr:aminotransferase class I/II-fold pyridoxal phosphate-dependent enzyme [Chloroflexota bacterium]